MEEIVEFFAVCCMTVLFAAIVFIIVAMITFVPTMVVLCEVVQIDHALCQ